MITVKEEAEKFKEQAEKDWETILLARAKELAPGKNYNKSFTLVHFGPSLCHATLRSRDREKVQYKWTSFAVIVVVVAAAVV